MPRVGSKQSKHSKTGGQPAADGQLLLVAAGEPAGLALRPGVDGSRSMASATRAFSSATSPNHRPIRLYRGAARFSLTGRLGKQRLEPVAGDEHHSPPDGVVRGPGRQRLAAHQDLARVGAAVAGQNLEQLVLSLGLEGGDAEDLAPSKQERNVVDLVAGRGRVPRA